MTAVPILLEILPVTQETGISVQSFLRRFSDWLFLKMTSETTSWSGADVTTVIKAIPLESSGSNPGCDAA